VCSILAILDLPRDPESFRERAFELSRLQRHRGPDWFGVHATDRAVIVHERLAIVDPASGAQPLYGPDRSTILAVNGEIYNHQELGRSLASPYPFRTSSDCEVLLALYRDAYEDRGAAFLEDVNGIFAFVLLDEDRGRYLVARDPVGVMPLYLGWDSEGVLHVASEMKALVPVCVTVREFPPGCVLDSRSGDFTPFRSRPWKAYEAVAEAATDPEALCRSLSEAVERQLMSDVPYGVLLSGGLDSSIVAALAARYARGRIESGGSIEAWWPRLHSFCIGLEGSPDLPVAREMAEHLGTVHHEFHFTVEEGLDVLRDVIYHLETYDVTTVRAATPMYLMARRIRAMGVKMVLSGEGADEIFGGYLYFHRAPDARSFHEETVRKVERLHLYDCLRANKSMAAWGVEARVPFLDLDFLDVAMSVNPADKMPGAGKLEKQILRDAFADLLPDVVLHRQKEQFSDGVGYGWIDALRDDAAGRVSDREMVQASHRFPHNPPVTKEGFLYRRLFEERFPLASAATCVPGGASVACSTSEALAWDDALSAAPDPSGRAVRGVHRAAY